MASIEFVQVGSDDPKLEEAFRQKLLVDSLPGMDLCDIARVVRRNWTKVNFAAEPYLEAMYSLRKVDDQFYEDSGKEIVIYFLANAQGWRGEVAKAVKAELNRRIK